MLLQPMVALLLGAVHAQVPPPSPPASVQPAPPQATVPPAKVERLRALVEAAERALEAEDEATAGIRADEADVLMADWPTGWLAFPDVQGLIERLKEVQGQLGSDGGSEGDPGLKATEEVITISGDELRAELELVRSVDRGAHYDFPIDLNDKVLTWVSLFSTTKRGFMENALGRASRYLPMVRQVFAEEGIPSDLAYLAVIESGFRNEAKSRARAVGMWQFIRSTGRIYGLRADTWLEERRDPVKSTRAAARYLKRLYEVTGDWYLAVSSYNAGPLTLDRAIQNLGTRNFWDLARSRWLRTETKNYVPELCAAILVGRNPDRYGIRVDPLAPYAYETVIVPTKTTLSVLARCAGTDLATLKALNPELLRPSTPPGSYQLRVPPGKAIETLRQMARLKGVGSALGTYTLRKGDTPASVARRFRVNVDELLETNDLTARQFRPGRRVQIPPAGGAVRTVATEGAGQAAGDLRPLASLPAVTGVLGAPNAKDATAMRVAAAAAAPPPSAPAAPTEAQPAQDPHPPAPQAAARRTVTARPGDTLAKLARTHGVALGELIRLNPAAAKRLHPGDAVVLSGDTADPTPTSPAPARPAPRTHRVARGETLTQLAATYRLSLADLRRWNRLRGDRIQVGQVLRLVAP